MSCIDSYVFIEYLFHVITLQGSGVNKRNEMDRGPAVMRLEEQTYFMGQEGVGGRQISVG